MQSWRPVYAAAGGLLSCPDRATGRDPPARRSERLPARAGGQARGRHRPAPDLVRPARSRAPCPRPARAPTSRRATGPTPSPRSSPGSGGCGVDHGEGRGGLARPSLVRPRALDHHVPVDRRGAGPDAHRGRPRPRRARRLAVADRPADRRPGAARWPAGPSGSPAARTTPPTWIRDADRRVPIVSISGTNGKSTVTRLITHILLLAGRHVGTTTSDGVLVDERMVEPGDWTGPGGAQQILARRDVDVAVLETARGGIVLRGVGYESNDASVLTNVSSDHLDLQGIHTLPELAEVKSTICRITKPDGWVVLNADDPLVAAVARRVRAHVALLLAASGDGSPRVRAASASAAAGPTSCATAGIVEANGARRDRRSSRSAGSRSRSAGWPGTTSPTRWPRPAGRAGWARRSRRSATACSTSAPTRRALAGPAQPVPPRVEGRDRRLRPQRGRASAAVLDVAEGIAGGAAGPGRADHRDHRHRRRPARRHAARASAGSPPSAPSGSRSRRRSSTCAAGPRSRSSASCMAGVVAGGGDPRPTSRSTTPRRGARRPS